MYNININRGAEVVEILAKVGVVVIVVVLVQPLAKVMESPHVEDAQKQVLFNS